MTIISIQVPYNSVSVVIFFKTMYKKQLLGSVFVILNLNNQGLGKGYQECQTVRPPDYW